MPVPGRHTLFAKDLASNTTRLSVGYAAFYTSVILFEKRWVRGIMIRHGFVERHEHHAVHPLALHIVKLGTMDALCLFLSQCFR